MTSSVTVWTSSSTAHVQARVAQIIGATRCAVAVHENISLAACNVVESKEKLDCAFNRLVSLTMSDSTLHIVAVIPIYEDNSTEQIQTLYDACSMLEHSITLHILGLTSGISPTLDAKAANSISQTMPLNLLKELSTEASFSLSFSLIDNYAENGAPLGFTIESLSHYISLIQIALMQDYYMILSPALLAAHQAENLSIGISSLTFNRVAVAQQMLGLVFIEALDSVGINHNEVDAQRAAREAESFLEGITKRYPALFDRCIKPLFKDQGLDEGRVVAETASIIDNDLLNLKNEILSLLKSDTLSLPEKEAVLAMILGRDNENIRGTQYDHEGSIIDDACEQPINLYVEAFNRNCRDSGLLPVRGDYVALKKYNWNENNKEFEDSPENILALNPLPYIKRLKQEIINTTSFIRKKQDELEDLQKSVRQREDAEDIKSKWHKPTGDFKDVEYKEQPLDEQYTPLPNLKIKESVDLRKFFTSVKNQSSLGACTSFAAVAMYEAMMNQAGVEGANDMSPAYLYFYSNILNGRPAGGSNFYEQFEVLGTHGVCHEDLYIYDPESPGTKPSDKADEDAKNHRVISAKQIPLIDDPDKSHTLKRNHTLLTSALSEGYPVGISLKVYDNLGTDGAFILHPDDATDAKEDGWHAMVIVGYSEENGFYIVRNSWGQEFGEDGYCYIPTAYIDDPEYMDFACIITEISDMNKEGRNDVPTVIANFAATESEIRIAAIRNAIAKVRINLKNSQKLYKEYYKYYQKLVMQLTMPKVQNDIRSAAETAQTINYINVDEQKRQLEDSFVAKLKDYKKLLRNGILSMAVITLLFGIVSYFGKSAILFICCLITACLCGITIFGYKWWKRIKRRKLQAELDQATIDAKRQAEIMLEMQIRFHVAGMWINHFHNLSIEIGNVYDRLVSYNNTLRIWQESYTRQIVAPEIPDGQMFRVLDASPLLHSFFQTNKSAIVRDVDLISLFDNYQVNPDRIDETHTELKNKVINVIYNLMGNFNIANFLLGDSFPYLQPANLQDEISTLISVGQPSYRNHAMNATPPIRILLTNVTNERANEWTSRIAPLFPMRPTQLSYFDSTSLILLTLHPQELATQKIQA